MAHLHAMGIHFRHIVSDRRHNIHACELFVHKFGLTMLRCSSPEHDAITERTFRTTKDHMQATIVSLPFKSSFHSKTSPLSPSKKYDGCKLDNKASCLLGRVLDKVNNSLSSRKIFGVVEGNNFNSNGPMQVWISARDSSVHQLRFDIVDSTQDFVDQIIPSQ